MAQAGSNLRGGGSNRHGEIEFYRHVYKVLHSERELLQLISAPPLEPLTLPHSHSGRVGLNSSGLSCLDVTSYPVLVRGPSTLLFRPYVTS